MKVRIPLLTALFLIIAAANGSAQGVVFTYQGRVTDNGTSVNGSEPSAAVSVGVTSGLFTVVMGDATIPNMVAIDASLFAQPNLQVRIWFNDGVHGSAALSPAQNLTPAPYAIMAGSA